MTFRLPEFSAADNTHLVCQDNLCDPLWVPEELVHIIVSDDALVILLLLDKDSVYDLVLLVPDEPVEWSDDRSQVETLWHRLYTVLTLWRAVVVICALEDEAQALWDKADLGSFSPTQQVERQLTDAVVVAHVGHSLAPSVGSALYGLYCG